MARGEGHSSSDWTHARSRPQVGAPDAIRLLAIEMIRRAIALHAEGFEGRSSDAYNDLLVAAYNEQADAAQSDAQLRGDEYGVSAPTDAWALAYWVACGAPSANRVEPPLPLDRQLDYAIECLQCELDIPKRF
jgi:hypothetical protein